MLEKNVKTGNLKLRKSPKFCLLFVDINAQCEARICYLERVLMLL